MSIVKLFEELDHQIVINRITPFSKGRNRCPAWNYIKAQFNKAAKKEAMLSIWAIVILNAAYTQRRLVVCVTREALETMCAEVGIPFNRDKYGEFLAVCSKSGLFDVKLGEGMAPNIFTVRDKKVLAALNESKLTTHMQEAVAFIANLTAQSKPSELPANTTKLSQFRIGSGKQ